MFSLLHDLPDIEVTGLINHPSKMLARALRRRNPAQKPGREIETLSRFIATMAPPASRVGRLYERAAQAGNFALLELMATFGIDVPIDRFGGADFGDFLWRTLFGKSLPAAEFERVRTSRYATLWSPWSSMHATALFPWRRYARVDSTGYDVFVSQTPWPGRVGPRTRLLVRYHDAVPVFLPHTVKHARVHQFFHMSALRENARSGMFACVSEYSRSKLLALFPALEKRAFVVFDAISEAYFPEHASRETVATIITSRIDASTAPKVKPASTTLA